MQKSYVRAPAIRLALSLVSHQIRANHPVSPSIFGRHVLGLAVLVGISHSLWGVEPPALLRIEIDPNRACIPVLSWDTEGGTRAAMNILRNGASVGLRVKVKGQWRAGVELATRGEKVGSSEMRYHLAIGPEAELEWQVRPESDRLTMAFLAHGVASNLVEDLELEFPFDPRVAATTLIPTSWDEAGNLHLPAIVSVPDFGQMLMTAAPHADLAGRLVGSRANHTVDLSVKLTPSGPDEATILSLAPVRLQMPAGLTDETQWRAARRGWFNMLQPSAQWGDQGNPFSAPPGILANNVISDPVSCLMGVWADHALLTPPLPAGISLPDLVRRTVDWWLDHRVKPSGEVFAYWDYADMLDANASPLIAAWDYVEATGDRQWLARRIERLELIADYLVGRDEDNDGLVESTHSGNYGTLIEPMRAGSAYDTINAGYKDAYCNALIYRAFCCLADLEAQMHRLAQRHRYTDRADRMKNVYAQTFLNPQTGWLAWWKSKDGEMHDLSSPMISSLAICYGLVDPKQGRSMLNRLWSKLEAVGFRRFDLGVPITLAPIRPGDYLMGPTIYGAPKNEDGSDTFGRYLNGGCCVSDAYLFVTALHIVGERDRGDRILKAMLKRQEQGVFPNGGGFQNGVVDQYPLGAEFYTWEGQTCGYEGHLTYSYSFLQALLLREASFRARLLRPLH
jgi:hypothetical protein